MFQVGLKIWKALDRLDVCSLSNSWLDSKSKSLSVVRSTGGTQISIFVSWVLASVLLLRAQGWSCCLSTVLLWGTLKCSGLLVCLLVVKHIPLVYQSPQGSLLFIVPASISLPILINLCQAKPQITCQINDWIPPALPWAFRKKGYHLLWVDYQSGLLWVLPPGRRKICSGSCRSVHALYRAVGNEITC